MDNYNLSLVILLSLLFVLIFLTESRLELFDSNDRGVSGSEPKYNPQKWNKKFYKQSHNCYEYALNDLDDSDPSICKQHYRNCLENDYCDANNTHMCRGINLFSQPGFERGYSSPVGSEKTCKNYKMRTIKDNPDIYEVNSNEKRCKNGYNKIALVVDPGKYYHYYRQDSDGMWSHKPGRTRATNLDESGELIYDPKTADRKVSDSMNYTDFCGYLCVPANKTKKTIHSHDVK